MKMEISDIVIKQREYFNSGATLPVKFRKEALRKLYISVQKHESEIQAALKADLGKSSFESYMCEIGMALSEISHMIKKIKKYAAPKRVHTPIAQFASKSYIQPTPYGNVLIMSPWNYPFLLSIGPLVDAIAAGDTAVVKPSAYSPATSEVVKKIITECFPTEYIAVVTGGRRENVDLLGQKFDFIFFTGSQSVGKEVLRHAAENLTPVVLELGGKSPCIVDDTAKIKLAAKRIVFGKFLNCGQTCVAPDYILCDKRVKNELIGELCAEITRQFGEKPLDNENYGKIINEKHFERICNLVDYDKVVFGGKTDKANNRIAPTVMDNVNFDDKVMQEEIFGPVLPVLTFEKFDEVFELIRDRQKPLALYLFSENKRHIKYVTERLRYGGGCINDTIIHLATTEMGFGGVGESGMGQYHGKAGFDAFSHTKSIVHKKTFIDLNMRYQPYGKSVYGKLVRFFLK